MKNNTYFGAVKLSESVEMDIESMQLEVIELIRALCAIPAPSHHEERRAAFVRDWFETRGIDAQIDEALNVYCEWDLDKHEEIVVITAHMDTVFPDNEPMPLYERDGKIFCPGVGDNTTNLAAMMALQAYLRRKRYVPQCGVLFVANSCEEGLGNLKGTKAIMKAYGDRVKAFLSLDCESNQVCVKAVGSTRYKISAQTEGGHSFADFGKRNAIEVLAQLIGALYAQPVAKQEGSLTTFNVGTIKGGTSVNTIAQYAEMTYEYRSDSEDCLEQMEKQLREILMSHRSCDAQIGVKLLGKRPGMGDVDRAQQRLFEECCCSALANYTGMIPAIASGSTDCNVPLSMGIPAVCFGVYIGDGEHTREEWIDVASISKGMKAALSVIIYWFEAARL